MKLYCVEVAPNPTKVRLYIAEKTAGGAPIEVTESKVRLMKGEQHQVPHRQRNPFASVPVLEVGEDDYIIESLAIMEYLEALFPSPNMSGATPRERARLKELERIADLRVLTPIARCIHATNSPLALPTSVDIAHQARSEFAVGLDYFDALLSDGRPLLAGETVSMSDCTLAAALQFARFAGLEGDVLREHVSRWDSAYRSRAAARRVLSH